MDTSKYFTECHSGSASAASLLQDLPPWRELGDTSLTAFSATLRRIVFFVIYLCFWVSFGTMSLVSLAVSKYSSFDVS
jgi:hypothetical protein